jgi:beta-lactam-binding protein with PASTA domain
LAKKSKKSKQSPKGGAGRAVAFLLLFALAGLGAYVYLKPSKILVPSVVGKSHQEAKAMLEALHLQADVRSEKAPGSESQAGMVLRQDPAADTAVPKGTVVVLFVVDLPAGVDVPEVVGKTRSEAEDILRRAGFEVRFMETHSDAVEVGRVISQNPAAHAKLESGETVTLTVSGGKGEQTVPDLVELSPDLAREQLKKIGLELVVLQVAQAGFREGDPVKVIRQEPDPGKKLPVGSRVTVFVPIPAPVDTPPSNSGTPALHAPRLEGLTVAQARELATSEGFVLELAEASEESSVITFQDPPPGDPLSASSESVLVRTALSSVVPGLTGLGFNEARARVEKADLTIGSVKKSYGPKDGEVLGQRPSAGIEVLAGSQVDLVVSDSSLAPDTARNPAPLPTPAFTPAPWVE